MTTQTDRFDMKAAPMRIGTVRLTVRECVLAGPASEAAAAEGSSAGGVAIPAGAGSAMSTSSSMSPRALPSRSSTFDPGLQV